MKRDQLRMKQIILLTALMMLAVVPGAHAFLTPTAGSGAGYSLYNLCITLYNTGVGFLLAFGFGGAGLWALGHGKPLAAIFAFIAAAGFFVLPVMVNDFGLII